MAISSKVTWETWNNWIRNSKDLRYDDQIDYLESRILTLEQQLQIANNIIDSKEARIKHLRKYQPIYRAKLTRKRTRNLRNKINKILEQVRADAQDLPNPESAYAILGLLEELLKEAGILKKDKK